MRAILGNIRGLRVDGTPLRESPSLDRVQRSIDRVLNDTELCAWATVTAEGQAHVNIGYFAPSDELDLYLLSHPSSLHCRNVAANPSMAVAVFSSAQRWTEPDRGVQLFGTCAEVAMAELPYAERIYGQRFPAYAEWKAAVKPGDPALDYRFYRFAANRIKILDESEFGEAVFVEAGLVRRET